jgi:hypothetical protein
VDLSVCTLLTMLRFAAWLTKSFSNSAFAGIVNGTFIIDRAAASTGLL